MMLHKLTKIRLLSERTEYLKPVLQWSLDLANFARWLPRPVRVLPLKIVCAMFAFHARDL